MFPARIDCRPFLILAAGLLAHAPMAAAETVATGEAPAPTSATGSSAASHEPTSALEGYAQRAAELRRTVLATGSLDYEQVLAVVYAPGMITDDVRLAKARWRASIPAGFTCVSDYALATTRARVEILSAVPDRGLHSTLVAQYEATSHVIGLSTRATDFALFHEAGHTLQRATLRARGTPAGRRAQEAGGVIDPVRRVVGTDTTTVRRLNYLCAQDEFEVRLQDLNRFHALLVAGRPIMHPGDSLRALVALGLPLEYEEAREAFATGGKELTREQFDHHGIVPSPASREIAVAFEDARELLLVRSLALRVDPDCWRRILAKIIFEAPGHL